MKKLLITFTIFLLIPAQSLLAEKISLNSTTVEINQDINILEPYGVAASDGQVFISSRESHTIFSHENGGTSLYAGIGFVDGQDAPVYGLHDDQAELAAFYSPAGIDIDQDERIYIADSKNHAIRVISPDGTVKTLAGDGVIGDVDGATGESRFYQPMDVAVANDGTVYVADTLNHVIRKISPEGVVTTLTDSPDRIVSIGEGVVVSAGDHRDGDIENALFNEPVAIELDVKGNLYVADRGNHVIRYIDFEAGEVSTVAGSADVDYNGELYLEGGNDDGTLDEAKFFNPSGLALTKEGNLVVADSGNHLLRLVNFDEQTVSTLEIDKELMHPSDVAMTETGDLIVADTGNNRALKVVMWEHPAGFGQYDNIAENYLDEADVANYAKSAIYQIQRLGVIVGVPMEEGMAFLPKKELTRAESVKILVEGLGLDRAFASNTFEDVPSEKWFAPYVSTASYHGLVHGYGDGMFMPQEVVTREEFAVMIASAMEWSASSDEAVFTDQNQISPWALSSVRALSEKGILVGDESGNFNPGQPMTREMAAVVMMRLVELID